MADCIFCKIVMGEILSQRIAETTNFVAFLDIQPATDGHTVIVPRKHSKDLLDFSGHLGQELLELAQRLGQAVIAAMDAQGFNFTLNNGPAAGQTVSHTHFHIIPRREGDGAIGYRHTGEPAALARVREAIVKQLG